MYVIDAGAGQFRNRQKKFDILSTVEAEAQEVVFKVAQSVISFSIIKAPFIISTVAVNKILKFHSDARKYL